MASQTQNPDAFHCHHYYPEQRIEGLVIKAHYCGLSELNHKKLEKMVPAFVGHKFVRVEETENVRRKA